MKVVFSGMEPRGAFARKLNELVARIEALELKLAEKTVEEKTAKKAAKKDSAE